MYVKSESGRGPVWLRELRILCKLCKLWTERRSSRSSRVDLNALITRSCKNREGRSIRKRGGKPATHKHAVYSYSFFFFAQRCVTVCPPFIFIECPLSVGVLWSCRCSGSCSRVFMIIQMRFFFTFILKFTLLLFFFCFIIANISLLFLFTSVT